LIQHFSCKINSAHKNLCRGTRTPKIQVGISLYQTQVQNSGLHMNQSRRQEAKEERITRRITIHVCSIQRWQEKGAGGLVWEEGREGGAVAVLNRHQREFFVESIVVERFPSGPAHYTCDSWVQPTRVHRDPRVFFTKPYLPAQTPSWLWELSDLRGEGAGRTTPSFN
jgi:hypothetical protein